MAVLFNWAQPRAGPPGGFLWPYTWPGAWASNRVARAFMPIRLTVLVQKRRCQHRQITVPGRRPLGPQVTVASPVLNRRTGRQRHRYYPLRRAVNGVSGSTRPTPRTVRCRRASPRRHVAARRPAPEEECDETAGVYPPSAHRRSAIETPGPGSRPVRSPQAKGKVSRADPRR